VLVLRNDPVVGRFNGDVGLVVAGADGQLRVAFPDEAGVTYLAPARLPEHQTVFAMTIHKSQGSEFDHALVVLPEQPSPVLTRELLYTAATRARARVTILGTPDRIEATLARTVRPHTGL
jgi:exodeoxyribonuclease V alpha subunit